MSVSHCHCFSLQYYEELLIEECIKDCSDDADLSDSGVVCFVSPPTQPSQSSQQQWQQPSSQQPYSIADDMQSLNMNSNAENRSTSNRRSSHSREQVCIVRIKKAVNICLHLPVRTKHVNSQTLSTLIC